MTPAGSRRLFVLVVLAMIAFAANSLLCRLALRGGGIDAASFTTIRIASGALVLWVIARMRDGTMTSAGSWSSAAALFGYAAAFSFAYVELPAAVGALILFCAVQVTMIGTGLVRGERLRLSEWLGLALAVGGLLMLTAPGLTAPDLVGSMQMVVAGVTWGIYSLRGQRAGSPVAENAGNFLKALPLALIFVAVAPPDLFVTPRGLLLAVVAGSITSGLAYAAWYAALPRLTAWRASIVQLSVPVATALAATVLLDERLTLRLIAAGVAIIGGVLLSVVPARTRTSVG